MEIKEEALKRREVDRDSFANYRRKYPGGRKSDNTWGGRLERIVKAIPTRLAFVQGERRLTWKQFDERVNRLANALLALGIKKVERVGIAGFNSIEWLESYFAISRIGAVPFSLNPRFTLDELEYLIEDADAVAMLVEGDYAATIKKVTQKMDFFRNLIVYRAGKPVSDVPSGALIYEDLMTKYPPTKPGLGYQVTNEDFCYLMYSGGTTGYPKGVVYDGETRVKGLETLIYNGFLPVMARISEEKVFAFANTVFPSPKALSPLLRRLLAPGLSRATLARLGRRFLGSATLFKLSRRFDSEGFKFLSVCPLFHGSAYNHVFGQIVAYGSSTVFLPTPYPFSTRELLETIEREKVNGILIAGDAHAIPILEELEKAKKEERVYDLSSLVVIMSSGVGWSAHIKKGLYGFMPQVVILDDYGTTETSIAYSSINTSDDAEILGPGATLPAKGVYSLQSPYKIISSETGREVEPGSEEVGEFVSMAYLGLGYWKQPKGTERSFRVIEGKKFFFTEDEGYVDEKGQFHFLGRGGNEVILTGGKRVYSEEVEEVIKRHPGVRDAGVVGVPDAELGEAVTAIIEAKKGVEVAEKELIAHCAQNLEGYKVPRHVIPVDFFPREATGKMEKRMLREFARGRVVAKGEKTGLTQFFKNP